MSKIKQTKQEILRKINEADSIIIHNHIRSDPDAVGSQGGLEKLLKANFPTKEIVAIGERLGSLSFLNKITTETLCKEAYEKSLVIVCDTATVKRIAVSENIKYAKYTIKIDHHPNNDPYGETQWVEPDFSSTSEMIFSLYKESLLTEVPWTMNNEAARLLYAGIVGDTGRFLFSNVTPSTFEAAAELIRYEFNPQEIFAKLYEKSERIARMEGKILTNFERNAKGIAQSRITMADLEELGVNSNGVSRLVNTMKEVRGNKIWVLFIEGEKEIRVNIRSAEKSIEEIAIAFNGGGHDLSAGATVYSWEEADTLIEELTKIV